MIGDVQHDFLDLLDVAAIRMMEQHSLTGFETSLETFRFFAFGASFGVFVVVQHQIVTRFRHEWGIGVFVEEVFGSNLTRFVMVGVVV